MSSALLYLAIVAIWALVLVPRWVRPRHTVPRAVATQTLESHLTEPAWPRRVEDFAWADEDEAVPDGEGPPDAPGHDGEAGTAAVPAPPAAGQPGRGSGSAAAERRASIVRARRRALIALIVLTGGAVGIAVRHLAAPWVVIPPGVMLAGFVLLLREAARSDARRAREIATRWHAAAGSVGRPVQAGAAGGTGQPEPATSPGAQVIDISARVGDQFYDQYADAAVRAVGD